MTKNKKIGNEIIAKFMDGIYSKNAKAWGFGNARVETEPITIRGKVYHDLVWANRFEKTLRYHSDWNLLMDVIKKIAMTNSETIETQIVRLPSRWFGSIGLESDIDTVWNTVVKYIDWLNQQNF